MSQQAWFEHFRERLQGLTKAYEESGTSMSLLGYALHEGYFSSEDYLKWAMTHYRLPFLQARFFTETPPSREMFAKWSTHYPWSTECLPVAEWDGALIVACVQPPQDFPSFPQSILVLSSLESLEEAWQRFHSETKSGVSLAQSAAPVAESAASVATAPEGINLSAATTKSQSDSFSFDDLGVAADAPAAELITPEDVAKEENLEGLFDNYTVTKLEALPPREGTISAAAPEDVIPESTATQTGIVTVDTNSSVVIEATPTPATQEPVVAAAAVAEAPNTTAKPIPPPPLAQKVAAQKPQTPPPFEDSFINRPVPVESRPITPAKPTLTTVANAAYSLEKLKKRNNILFSERVKKALSEMRAHFDKSMILTLDEQETQAAPFAWDENFKAVKDASARIPLKTPSIFNIVAATSKPFHGYVSLNEINEKFFEDWNQGNIPDHITIAPIIINDKLVGMLVGFAEKSAYNRASLNLAEKLSSDFTKGLQAA